MSGTQLGMTQRARAFREGECWPAVKAGFSKTLNYKSLFIPLAQGMQIEEVRGSVCVAGSTNESMPREKPALVKMHKVQEI